MAITYTIQPNPHWVIIDNFSKLPNGAAIYTYSSLNPSAFKPAFQDAAGTIPYDQPIVGFGNGTMPPIFWEFDSANPTDTYYIRVYDSADTTIQNFLWDFDGLPGEAGSGGGTIVANNDIQNLVVNGAFYRHVGTQTGAPSIPTFITLAPSNNAGYVGNLADPNGPASPDIIFAKNNQTASDSLSFPLFTPNGIASLAPNPTPINYLNYTSTGAGSGETYKYIQFPIVQGLQNLSGQTCSIKIFARLNSGNANVTLTLRQFFGNGGSPSADVVTAVGSPAITSSWQSFIFNGVVIPSIAGKTIGTCGNDGLFLQVNFPLSALVNVDIVLPSLYLVNVLSASAIDFHSYDQVDAIVNSPRTGDQKITISPFTLGWVAMLDGTIGNASSTAFYANIDAFPLFDMLWNTFVSNQSLAPMFTSTNVNVAYGADPFTDFNANNKIQLTFQAGRAIAGVNSSHLLGTFVGAENQTLVTANIPAHTHPSANNGGQFIGTGTGGNIMGAGGFTTSIAATTGSAGSGASFPILPPTTYRNLYFKL